MADVSDAEDLLALLEEHAARYLIVGGLAFIYHAKPRYTKDMDLWVDPDPDNVARVNAALQDFPSPELLDPDNGAEILQLGVAPNRVDLIRRLGNADFARAWDKRIRDYYGTIETNWIDIESLLEIKSAIDHPRHQEDARVLRDVLKLRRSPSR
jgi:hypothetical protein